MTMTAIERRWLSVVLPSFLDPTAGGFGLDPGEVDFERGALTMYGASSLLGRVGMRASLLFVMLSPLFILGRVVSFASLGYTERSALLARICAHRHFALRGMGVLLKLAASMAMFRVASVRNRTNHDRAPMAVPARRRVTLPLRLIPSTGAA
ncbi:MAG: hypothetical protein Q8S73_32935 [Deltaproteobacteria bacterium]|nr:hypothetical protein [Myxococcales bacterium]MDP3218951.1 hypothetical protein [Deltaproteobacteria bacterium]